MFLEGHVEFLHETRKRVITLQQQMEVIRRLDPTRIARIITRLHDVATALGDDHDLVVLSGAMASERGRFHELTPILQLESQISKRRSRTQKRAFKIGSAVLEKKGRQLGERLMRRWK
jgi:CHAD domain-containing protein